jgi:hypothetical protein
MFAMTVLSGPNLERFMAGDLYVGSYEDRVSRIIDAMGLPEPVEESRVVRAIFAMDAGVTPDLVAKYLDWKDFERFCSRLIGAKGFTVTRDLRLKQPRAQIDILARSPSLCLIVDCKHWARERGPAALSAVVERQTARALLVRRKMKDVEPMAVVVLSLANEQPRYVDGAAVVPVRTLADFLDNIAGYSTNLSFY